MKKIKNPPKMIYQAYINYCNLKGIFHTTPDYLIIGAEKCGTTSLYEYLLRHPNIIPAKGKEISYFDNKFRNGFGWYKTFFPSLLNKKCNQNFLKNKIISGEATPRYLNHPHAPKRVLKLLPKIKLIVLLRNPVDRAYSHYQMEVIRGREKLSFEKAIECEKERISEEFQKMEIDDTYYSRKYYWFSHLEAGIYIKQLKRWMGLFPKNQFLIIQSEDLFKNTTSTYNVVLKFLGLSHYELPEYKKFKERKYQKLDTGLRKKLSDYFQPYNEQLYQFLGRDFSWEQISNSHLM